MATRPLLAVAPLALQLPYPIMPCRPCRAVSCRTGKAHGLHPIWHGTAYRRTTPVHCSRRPLKLPQMPLSAHVTSRGSRLCKRTCLAPCSKGLAPRTEVTAVTQHQLPAQRNWISNTAVTRPVSQKHPPAAWTSLVQETYMPCPTGVRKVSPVPAEMGQARDTPG